MLELKMSAVFVVLIGGLIFGVATYWLRCRFRFLYGTFEVVVGLAVIFVAVFPVGHDFLLGDKVPSTYETLLNHAVTLLAGIYIIVRGFDNIDKGLPERYRKPWDKLFHGRRLYVR